MTVIPETYVLIDARKLVADPAHWVKGANKLAGPVARFCMVGAIAEASKVHPLAVPGRAVQALWRAIGCEPSLYNDARATTHADILAALDRAIAVCSACVQGDLA